MKWSLKIGRIAGIDVYVHATFLILLIWIAASEYLAHQTAAAMLGTIGFVALIFTIIVLHELGHALAARKYGIQTQDITLLPIGGLARLDRIPEDPRQELVVAFAGPLVNFVIAGGLFVGIVISAGLTKTMDASLEGGNLMARLLWVNLWFAGFNLLPAFPMDGGRVLRALLALKLSRERATEMAVNVGHAMALIFGAVGLFGIGPFHSNPFLLFIAFFVWVGAEGELQYVRLHATLGGLTINDVMTRKFESLTADAALGDVADRLMPGFQRTFPVLDGGKLLGFIDVDDIARGLAASGPNAKIGSFARTDFKTAAPADSLEHVVSDGQSGANSVIAAMDGEKLVGIVTPSNIGEHIMIRSALARRPA